MRKDDAEELNCKIREFLSASHQVESDQPPEVKSLSDRYPGDSWPNPELIVNTPEQAMPLEENQGAAFECCKRYRKLISHRLPEEDFRQIVFKCLWGAALQYDETKYPDVRFVTFLWTVCERRVRYEINRFYYKPGHYMSAIAEIWENIQDINSGSVTMSALEKITFESVIELNLKVNNLRDAEILVEHLLFGHTLEECGKKHGITRERVRQIEQRAVKRLRENFGSFKGEVKLIS